MIFQFSMKPGKKPKSVNFNYNIIVLIIFSLGSEIQRSGPVKLPSNPMIASSDNILIPWKNA